MPEYINLIGFIGLALFRWKITRDVSGVEKRLSDKIDAAERHLNSRIDNLYSNLLNKS